MIKIGSALIILALIIWIVDPIYAIFANVIPHENYIIGALAIGVIGSILVLLGVAYDRYKEYKEEKENNDYRKY
ncbi:MAG: hypothetical protein AB7V16_00750 [Vulcanibacillus sp.]